MIKEMSLKDRVALTGKKDGLHLDHFSSKKEEIIQYWDDAETPKELDDLVHYYRWAGRSTKHLHLYQLGGNGLAWSAGDLILLDDSIYFADFGVWFCATNLAFESPKYIIRMLISANGMVRITQCDQSENSAKKYLTNYLLAEIQDRIEAHEKEKKDIQKNGGYIYVPPLPRLEVSHLLLPFLKANLK